MSLTLSHDHQNMKGDKKRFFNQDKKKLSFTDVVARRDTEELFLEKLFLIGSNRIDIYI